MRDRQNLLLGFLLGVLILTGCARPTAPSAISLPNPIRPGMSEAEIVQLLGPPGLVMEQPAVRVSVPTPTGMAFHEKRRYTYYYCLLYTSPSPRDGLLSRMPSSA